MTVLTSRNLLPAHRCFSNNYSTGFLKEEFIMTENTELTRGKQLRQALS